MTRHPNIATINKSNNPVTQHGTSDNPTVSGNNSANV
jgi:hypothetical protein